VGEALPDGSEILPGVHVGEGHARSIRSSIIASMSSPVTIAIRRP